MPGLTLAYRPIRRPGSVLQRIWVTMPCGLASRSDQNHQLFNLLKPNVLRRKTKNPAENLQFLLIQRALSNYTALIEEMKWSKSVKSPWGGDSALFHAAHSRTGPCLGNASWYRLFGKTRHFGQDRAFSLSRSNLWICRIFACWAVLTRRILSAWCQFDRNAKTLQKRSMNEPVI